MPGNAALPFGDELDHQGEHSDFYVGFDAPACAVMLWRHFDLGSLERAKAALDYHQSLAAAGGIFQTDGVIIGLDHGDGQGDNHLWCPKPFFDVTELAKSHWRGAPDRHHNPR